MTKASKQSLAVLCKACWESTLGERTRFWGFIVLFIVSNTLALMVPWTIGYTLGIFVEQGFNEEAYDRGMWYIGAYMVLRLAQTFCHHVARYLQNTVAYSARMYTLNKVFSGLLAFPLNWHVESHSGDNLSKLHRSAGAIETCIGTYVWQVIEGVVKLAFASFAILALDFWVAVNVLCMGIITVLVMIFFNKKLAERWRNNNSFANKISRICIDYLFNIVTVKTLNLERAAQKYLAVQRDEGLGLSKKISQYSELKWGTTALGYGIVIGSSLFIYFSTNRSLTGQVAVAQAYVLLAYLDQIFQAIGSFTAYYGGILEAATAYEDGNAILKRASTLPPERSASSINNNWQKISIKNLVFSYIAGERSGLKDMALDISRRDKIALVGPSGGGKSTLLKILGGMLVPEQAKISTDAQENLSIQDVAHLALLIPQEPEIFSETFHYNLTMGESFPEDELNFLVTLGKVESILAKLPRGMETDLAEKGLNLSVGEKQRVAMIRGLLRASKKDILLLDEPTSSLDPKTEKDIFFALLSHFSDRVIITACHRLNLVPLFDKIIFVRDGCIEEIGSFTDLLKKGGAFAKAWEDYMRKLPQAEEALLEVMPGV